MTVPGHPLKPLRTVDLLGYDGYCMILEMSKFYNPLRYHQPFHRRRLTDGILIVVFFYLILYSIFNTLYLHWTPPLEPPQPGEYNIRNVTVKHVDCLFSISSQYQRAPRYICYFLLIFTFVSRNYEWLAAGAAASVLTYSGVTVIHLFILFATNNKLNMPNAKTHCESLPIPGQSAPFVACAGVHETDVDLATNILSNVMFAALPVAAWSKTFRGSRSKAVLVSWLVFLAVGHTLNTLISPNWSAHFQICAKDHVESVSAANFQATLLDQNWRESFRSLVGVSQQDYHSALNSSLPACIYSCFITEGYIGRKAQDIRVLEGVISGTGTILKTTSTSRHFAIVFWWLYTFLAFLTLMTTEKQRWLPKWMYVGLFSIRYPQAWVGIASISMKRVKHVLSVEHREADLPVTVLVTVQSVTQVISAGIFCGSIILQELQNDHLWTTWAREPFSAVGQWGNLAVVLLVMAAAGISKICASRRGFGDSREGLSLRTATADLEEGLAARIQFSSMSHAENDWDCRVGYAS